MSDNTNLERHSWLTSWRTWKCPYCRAQNNTTIITGPDGRLEREECHKCARPFAPVHIDDHVDHRPGEKADPKVVEVEDVRQTIHRTHSDAFDVIVIEEPVEAGPRVVDAEIVDDGWARPVRGDVPRDADGFPIKGATRAKTATEHPYSIPTFINEIPNYKYQPRDDDRSDEIPNYKYQPLDDDHRCDAAGYYTFRPTDRYAWFDDECYQEFDPHPDRVVGPRRYLIPTNIFVHDHFDLWCANPTLFLKDNDAQAP